MRILRRPSRGVLAALGLVSLALASALHVPREAEGVFAFDAADELRDPLWLEWGAPAADWFDGTLRAGGGAPRLHARRHAPGLDRPSPWQAFDVHLAPDGSLRLAQLEGVERPPAERPAAPAPEDPAGRLPRHARRVELPGGGSCEVWDVHDGRSFDVHVRWSVDGATRGPFVVAGGPAFEARPELAVDRRGRVWCLWEEGGEHWGEPHRGRIREWNTSTDAHGPLHRLRRLRLARLDPDGGVALLDPPLPQPAFEALRARDDRREGVHDLGGSYERGVLTVDAHDRLWVAYAHVTNTQAGCGDATVHHVDEGWRVYARCLSGTTWGPLTAFRGHVRDGLQELALAPLGDGVLLCWNAGRRDRRRTEDADRGVALAHLDPGPGPAAEPRGEARPAQRPSQPLPTRDRGPALAGQRLFLGDLHRHTDLSLCFPFFDGSLDDAQRYGRDVAELDFLAVTDHTRDLDHGAVDGPLWERVVRAVDAAHEPGRFVTLHAFERSHGQTDHNVITLDPGVLEDFPPPLADYWSRIDPERTITIPHNPILPKAWDVHDDLRRPLAEVYQGCRDEDSLGPVHEGWRRGQRFGLIASSDHMSTSASYAGVWATELTREALFEALRARRTFGATAPMRLALRSGEHWMGEVVQLTPGEPLPLQLEVRGCAPLRSLSVWLDEEEVRLPLPRAAAPEHPALQVCTWDFEVDLRAGNGTDPLEDLRAVEATFLLNVGREDGPSRVFVVVEQLDGERAWSSPLFLER